MSSEQLATDLLARHAQLKADRSSWDALFQELADFVMPRKDSIANRKTASANANIEIFDTTAIDACQVEAAGTLQHVTPASERWFDLNFPAPLLAKNMGTVPADASGWLSRCTEILLRELQASNFYTEIHETYLDRTGMGTCCIFAQEGKKSALNFKCVSIGTYSICEDEEGLVDTVFREFPLTARQAVQRFGEDKVGPKILECYRDKGTKSYDTKFTFVHAVYPRADDQRQKGKMDPRNKPFASVTICQEDKTIVKESGFDEQPFCVSRYLSWGDEVYGWCPTVATLPTIRQLNFIERQLDVLAEKAAFPPMLIPASMTGNLDISAGGITIFDENSPPTGQPREWQTQGRYDIGKDRTDEKRQSVKKAFHNDMFEMFANLTQQITAYEAMQRTAEKLINFSPTFYKLTTELVQPLLQRCFAILFRAGLFPDPPASLFTAGQNGKADLAMPQITFTSKVALAIKAMENRALVDFMGTIQGIVQFRPDVLDNVDFDKVVTDLMRNYSLPANWVKSGEVVDQERASRAQQQQAQAQIGAAQGIAAAGADLGKAPPDVQKQLTGMLSGASGRN